MMKKMSQIAQNYNVPVVRAFDPQEDMAEFLKYVHDMEELEGFVVRFDTGHMVKLKCHWYINIHKAKEAILQDRNIVEMILENSIDDIKAHLLEEDRINLINFEYRISQYVREISAKVFNRAEYYTKTLKLDRKTFALQYAAKEDPFIKPLIFSLWDDNSKEKANELVVNTIRNSLTTNTKYNILRDKWFEGVTYNQF